MAAFSWFTEQCYLQSLRAKRVKGEQSVFYIINKFASKSVFLLLYQLPDYFIHFITIRRCVPPFNYTSGIEVA